MRNRKKSRANHWLKIGAWIVGIAIFLFVGLFFFTNWLQSKLESMVANQSNGIYKLDLYGLQVSPFVGGITADSVALSPDYAKWEQVQQNGKKAPRTLLDLETGNIKIRGLNLFKAIFGSGVALNILELNHPDLLFTVMRRDTTQQHKPLHETVQGMIKGLEIGTIDVNQAKLQYREKPKQGKYLFAVKQFNLTVDDFKLDSQSFNAEDRAYYAKKIALHAAGASYRLPDGLYKVTSDSLSINTNAETLLAKQIKLTPLASPANVAKAKGTAVTYNEAEVALVRLNGLNYAAHSRYNQFLVQHLLIQSPVLKAFKDKQNFTTEGKKPLPHEMVQSIKTKFLIDSIELKSGFVRYSELVPKATERGHATFESINASITNFTNIPDKISMENPAIVQVNMQVMGKAPLDVTARLPLLHKNGYHTIKGKIGASNPEILNPILAPTAFMKIESGYISGGNFDVELTNDQANGTMRITYSNLEIELLSKGTGGEQGLGKEVLSELANWIAIKESNKKGKDGQVRVGDISVTRSETKSVFNYWKDCIASGFLSSMGLQGMSKK